MLGKFSEQIQINAPASEVWNLYGTIQLSKFLVEKLPQIVEKVELIEGDGGTGSVLQISLQGNAPYKEKFVLVDDEKRVKEIEIVEGGLLDLGFNFYKIKLEIIEKDDHPSIINFTTNFEINDVEKIHLAINNFKVLLS
ncbi:hypothetical protein P3S68_032740 [Capsicum galapagoense]